MSETKTTTNKDLIEKMFSVGAHFGFSKSRRHPSTKKFIFGVKNKTEIFDLEKTSALLPAVEDFLKEVSAKGKKIVFLSSKPELASVVKDSANSISMPYVARRWIGGTFTNFDTIKKRIGLLINLLDRKEKGDLAKYTKKERLMFDRQIEDLEDTFGGLKGMEALPAALVVVDPKEEEIAVKEAIKMKIPVVAIANSDCDITKVDYPLVANDNSKDSVALLLGKIVDFYRAGK